MEGEDLECEVNCLKFKSKQLSEIQKSGNTSTPVHRTPAEIIGTPAEFDTSVKLLQSRIPKLLTTPNFLKDFSSDSIHTVNM